MDLRSWQVNGAGSWTVAANGLSVDQTINGDPTFFVSNFNVSSSALLEGSIQVFNAASDDDYIGFALGRNTEIFSLELTRFERV